MLDDLFKESSGQVFVDLLQQLDQILREQLPSVLWADEPQVGTQLARQLRESLSAAINTYRGE
jgi:hypothetical protein